MAVLEARRVRAPSWANLRTILGLLLFCLALLGGQRVLEGARDTVVVWGAARDLPATTTIDGDDLRPVEVVLSRQILDRYVEAGRDLDAAVLTRPVLEGELVTAASVAEGEAAAAGRSMTVPVDPAHSVGGRLRLGDRVDVLASFDSGSPTARTSALVSGAEVLDLVTSGGLVTGAEALVGVTVAVTPDDATRLAFAIRNAEIDIVRVDGGDVGSGAQVSAGDLS